MYMCDFFTLEEIRAITEQPNCPQCYNVLFHPILYPVTVRFAKETYTVSEAVGSQNLALFVCVYASTAEKTFTVNLLPTSGTAVGKYHTHNCGDQ